MCPPLAIVPKKKSSFTSTQWLKKLRENDPFMPTANSQATLLWTFWKKQLHGLDRFCAQYNIRHHVLRPRNPWHNGKAERSHRNDQERFYNHLSFYSFDDLQMQMNRYLKRANNIPMAVLGWKSPTQKHRELGGNWLTLVFSRIVTALSTVEVNGKPLLTKLSQSELT